MTLILSIVILSICLLKKKSKVVFFLAGIWLWILTAFSSGLADESIYVDRYNDYNTFYGLTEPGFTLIMKLFNAMGFHFETYKMIVFAVELVLILSTIERLSDNKNFVIAMYIIFPLCMDATQMRFTLGLSITIFGSRFLFNDEATKHKVPGDIKYAICVIVASMFHFVNILFFLLLIAKHISKKKVIGWTLGITLAFSVILNANLLIKIGNLIGVGLKIKNAIRNSANLQSNLELTTLLRMVVFFLLFLLLYYISGKLEDKRKTNKIDSKTILNMNIIIMCVISLLQFSVDFYRCQVGISILNYIYFSNTLADENMGKIKLKNVIITSVSLVMVITNLYYLVLNNRNINTVFWPFFSNNSLM